MQNSLESLFCFSTTAVYYSVLVLLGILVWKYSHEDDNISSLDLKMMVITLASVIGYKLKRRGPGRGKLLGILCQTACVLMMLVVIHDRSWMSICRERRSICRD